MTDIMLLEVERDMAPQWRHLVWTSDCNLLVIAGSSGAVEVCDTVGNQVGGGEGVLEHVTEKHDHPLQVYHLISPRIPASQPGWADSIRSGPVSSSYAGVFFTEVRIRDKSWVRLSI